MIFFTSLYKAITKFIIFFPKILDDHNAPIDKMNLLVINNIFGNLYKYLCNTNFN